MTPLTTVNSNGSINPRNKRSITSKVGSLFTTKSSHIIGFSIELDEPYKQHVPGETVKGTVVLNVGRPLGVTHVVASLYGYVQVFKHHSKPSAPPRGNSTRVATGQNKRWVSEYYGDGFASLFEEEIVLCGEGRLDPKLYHFRFEIDFPSDLDLPSSIDFERGTITYMVSATVTRPSTIGTTTSCEKKVWFREDIDVGQLTTPKPREVTLRALDQGTRPKNLKRLTSYEKKRSSNSLSISRTNQSGRTLDEISSQFTPSVASSRSRSSSRDRVASLTSELRTSQHSRSPKRSGSEHEDKKKTIFITVEPSKSGCIPGEVLSIAIQVQHSKIIQSSTGVIATLYRQAMVDMHPNLPISSNIRSRDGRFEDYYPRSKTGLGGLSLTAAGSSQVWRKDLSQSLAPFYIDPRTMSTEVRVAVRIPNDVFPSIRSVPGEMISFRYYIEVIIDIHGKLGTAELASSTSNLQQNVPTTPRGQNNESPDYVSNLLDSNYIDTSTIRREKNALVVECELTIGTRDSNEKARGKQRATSNETDNGVHEIPLEEQPGDENINYGSEWFGYDDNGYCYGIDEHGNKFYYTYDDDQYNGHDDDDYQYHYPEDGGDYASTNGHSALYPPQPYPIPPIEDESAMSEKERLRRAEARLLPSQPPMEGESETITSEHNVPSAPILLDEEQYISDGRTTWPQSLQILIPDSPRQSSHSHHASGSAGLMAPVLSPDGASSSAVTICHSPKEQYQAESTDKLEDKRNHLEAQVNSPHTYGISSNEGPSAPSVEEAEEAAILGVNHEQRSHIERLAVKGEPLPRYER